MSVHSLTALRIKKRDHETCQECGRKPPEVKLEVDHIVPESLGGKAVDANLRTFCVSCNRSRGNGLARVGDVSTCFPSIKENEVRNLSKCLREKALLFFSLSGSKVSFEKTFCAFLRKCGKYAAERAWRNAVVRLVADGECETFGDAADRILFQAQAFALSDWGRDNGRFPGWTAPSMDTWLNKGHHIDNPKDWIANEAALDSRGRQRRAAERVAAKLARKYGK